MSESKFSDEFVERRLSGQWIGVSEKGLYCVVNINDRPSVIDGRVSMYQAIPMQTSHVPIWTLAYMKGEKGGEGKVFGTVGPPLTHWEDGRVQTLEEREELEKTAGVSFPVESTFVARSIDINRLEATWTSMYPGGEHATDSAIFERRGEEIQRFLINRCAGTTSRLFAQPIITAIYIEVRRRGGVSKHHFIGLEGPT